MGGRESGWEGGREGIEDLEHFFGLIDLGHLVLFGLALLPGHEGVKGHGSQAALLPQLGPLFLYLRVDIVVLVGAQDRLGLGCIIVRVQEAGVRQGKAAAGRCWAQAVLGTGGVCVCVGHSPPPAREAWRQ